MPAARASAPASAPDAPHPTERRTTGRRTPHIPQRVLDDLAEGLEREQWAVARLNTPGGLLDHHSKAALDAYTRQLNEPMIAVHAGVLHINGHPQPSGTVSLIGLIQALRGAPAISNASAPAALRGGKRRTKKTT